MFMLIDISLMIGSLGIVLAVSSFISGLQLVKGKRASIEGIIHRTNGYLTVTLFFILAVLAIWSGKVNTASFLAPSFGLGVFLVKLWIIRRGGRRLFRYVSRAGGCLILTWLFIYYHHMPV